MAAAARSATARRLAGRARCGPVRCGAEDERAAQEPEARRRADESGAHLSSVPATQRWDVTSLADVSGLGLTFGLATRPPMDIGLPVFVVSLNSSSGEVINVTDALPGVLDAEDEEGQDLVRAGHGYENHRTGRGRR